MADETDFDGAAYLRAPKLDVRQGIALVIALLSAVPKLAPERVKKAAEQMRSNVLALQKTWGAKRRVESAAAKLPDKALADNRIDTAWGGLKGRVDDYANLPAETHPQAARAAELSHLVFPNGLGFLAWAMDKQWAEGQAILARIDEDELQPELDLIAGKEFLAEVRAAQAVYGDVLGITKAKEEPITADTLVEPLRALTRGVGDYALQVVASVDREKPATIARARAALLPLDRLRAAAAKRSTAKKGKAPAEDAPEPDVTPETPVPEVPA